MGRGWEFWIDRGGTFTDVVARRPDGTLAVHKLLSQDPARYADPAVAGIRHMLGVPDGAPIPAEQISVARLGTTVATNALLERQGEPTVLVITRGFGDALRIAYQDRPRIFDRQIVRPEMVYTRVIEATERIGAHGDVVTALDEDAVGATCGPLTARVSGRWRCCACTATGTRRTRPGSARSPATRVSPRYRCRIRPAR